MENIILIGMPGSGKSTVGVLLAKLIGYSFLDTDLLIQQKEGKKLFEILRDHGPAYFAEVENEVNRQIVAEKTVIATGGSVIYGEEAMAHLKTLGKIVYLQVELEELARRLGNFSTRGVLMRSKTDLDGLYRERVPLYEKYADITVACGSEELITNAERIVEMLGM